MGEKMEMGVLGRLELEIWGEFWDVSEVVLGPAAVAVFKGHLQAQDVVLLAGARPPQEVDCGEDVVGVVAHNAQVGIRWGGGLRGVGGVAGDEVAHLTAVQFLCVPVPRVIEK